MKGNLINTFNYIRQYGTKSIHFRNLIIITLFIIIPLVFLSAILFNITIAYINEEVKISNTNILDKSMYTVDNELKRIQDMFFLLSTDSSILSILNSESIDLLNYNDLEKVKTVINTFGIANSLDSNISDFFIYLRPSDSVIDSKGFFSKRSESRFAELIDGYSTQKESVAKNIYQYSENDGNKVENYFVLTHRISSQNQANGAVFFIKINERDVNGMININEPLGMILNEAGRFLSHAEPQMVGTLLERDIFEKLSGRNGFYISKKDDAYIAWTYTTSDYTSWKYVSAVSLDILYQKINYYKHLFVVITLITVCIVLVISPIVTNKLSEPINILLSFLNHKNSWFDGADSNKIKFPEIRQITSNMMTSLKENEELKLSLQERIQLLKKAQFDALQSQINPHFLYNTLEAINWSIRERLGLVNEPSMLINSLSEFLRFSLESGDNLICIANEIASLRNYINIQKFRLGNDIEVYWDIPEALYQYKMIKISLQPLVENAILHGVKNMKKDAQIMISGKMVEEKIQIEIKDNGKGMDPNLLEQIRLNLKENQFYKGESIGIRNVNLRYKILFGDLYGLAVNSRPSEGTQVVLTFPAVPVGQNPKK